MDVGLWAGVTGSAAAVIAVPVAWYYGHRAVKPAGNRPHIQVRVENEFPVYDVPGGGQRLGDHFVAVKAANIGECAVTITGWGVKLPGDRRIVVPRTVNWSTPLPYRLEPRSAPARFVLPGDELFRLEREQNIPFKRMRAYVTLADDTNIDAGRGIPLKAK